MNHHPGPERGPRTIGEKLAVLGCLLALFGAIVAEVTSSPEPRKLAALFFLLAWPPLLVLHELGHALAAMLVGFRIDRVVLGFGAPRAELRVFGVPVEVRSLPLTGFVSTRPDEGRGTRLAHAFVYAAGPGIELALAAAFGSVVGWSRFLAPSDDVGLIALQAIAVAGTTGAVLNLLPGSTAGPRGEIPNDGLGILLALFGRRR